MNTEKLFLRLACLLMLLAGLMPASSALAQQYLFQVPEMRMEVFVNSDASVRIEYEIVFENERRARPIDAVDIGLFHSNYSISNMRASLDGAPLPRISRSPYVDPGVEVNLGRLAIAPGSRGTFRFVATIPDMVYQDTTNQENASLRVTPTWFDGRFVRGTTRLRIAVHVPPGVDGDAVLFHHVPFSGKAMFGERVVAYWELPAASVTGAHLVGVSFPKHGMSRVVEMSRWELLTRWWEGNPEVRIGAGVLAVFSFAIFFFRLTAGTGWSLFLMLAGGLGYLFFVNPQSHLVGTLLWPGLLFALWYPTRPWAKPKYLPPIASVEGGGIKRGLTAPEAAVLLELPKGKLVTLVAFGLLKKKVLRMTSDEPLQVTVVEDYVGERPARLEKAAERGVVLHAYEHEFIDAIQARSWASLADVPLHGPLNALIEHAAKRVAGFDLEETRRYYRYIIKRAWADAESLGEVPQRDAAVDKNLEWLLMEPGYRDGFGRMEATGYYYRPMWLRFGGSGRAVASASSSGVSGSTSFTPSFGDVAGSFAGWTENLSGQVASSIMPDSGGKAPLLDLSSFDSGTTSFFEALMDGSGGSGGGGGGGGGCACAGCACACACAGGGR